MRLTCTILLMILVCAAGARPAAPATPAMPEVWFEDIRTPAVLSEADGLTLVRELRDGLQRKVSADKLVKLAPADNAPRVLFLSLGDGNFPERTYYAAGKNFADALRNLLLITAKREAEYAEAISGELAAQIEQAKEEHRQLPKTVKAKLDNPTQWQTLRLDIVQAAVPVKGYVIASSRLLLSSTVGIAFDRNASFAFTPELLTGRCLMTAERQLSIPNISNIIAESTNWVAFKLWNSMGSSNTAFNVSLFETDSYLADASHAVRLFRGHPVRTGADCSVNKLNGESLSLLNTLLKSQNDSGRIAPVFPEWSTRRYDDKLAMLDQAQLVCTLLQAAELPQLANADRKHFFAAADKAVQRLLKNVRRFDANEGRSSAEPNKKVKRRPAAERTYAAIVEDEDNTSGYEQEVPRRIIDLRSTAMAYLAFSDIAHAKGGNDALKKECLELLPKLHRYIIEQLYADGHYIPRRLYPELKPLDDDNADIEPLLAAETSALAGLAVERHLAHFSEDGTPQLRQFMSKWRDMLLECFGSAGTAAGEPLTPWLAVYLCETANPEKADADELAKLTRLAIAAASELELTPMLPDMFGAPQDIPSMTYAAERLWLVAEVARLLQAAGHAEDAAALLNDAWPLRIFAAQADMGTEAASILPDPDQYIGFTRDNLADFGFTLNGITTQILSRLNTAKALAALNANELTPSEANLTAWQNSWSKLDNRPLCVSESLAVNGGKPGPENSRALGGKITGKSRERSIQGKGSYVVDDLQGDSRVSSRVLERKK